MAFSRIGGWLVSVMACGAIGLAAAQAPASNNQVMTGRKGVVGTGNYSPVVADLERSIAFYENLVGLGSPPVEAVGRRPFNTEAGLLRMFGLFGVPGGQIGYSILRIPGSTFGVEPVELRGLEKTALFPRVQDPGSATLVLMVRDLERAFAPLRKAGVPIITPGGGPIAFGPGNRLRGVIVSDPDGHFVELLQPDPLPETTAPIGSNILGARVRMTVASTEGTTRIYRDVLEMDTQVGEFEDLALLDLMNLKGSQLRLTTAVVPGSVARLDFIELKGVAQTPVRPRLQDPGATRFQLRVGDLEDTMAKLKAAGSSVISTGGEPASLPGGVRAAIMPDPDQLFFVLIQAR